MPDFQFACPFCETLLDCPEELDGVATECPVCKETIVPVKYFIQEQIIKPPIVEKKSILNNIILKCVILNDYLDKNTLNIFAYVAIPLTCFCLFLMVDNINHGGDSSSLWTTRAMYSFYGWWTGETEAAKALDEYIERSYQNLADIKRRRKIIEAGDAEVLKLLKYLQSQRKQY